MRNYYRVMLGKNSIHAQTCFDGGFIGADYQMPQDLTNKLPDDWREFNREFIPVYLASRPDKTRVAAGLACGALWSVAKGIQEGDLVFCPDGSAHYHVGEVTGGYTYQLDGILPHRRPVRWLEQTIDRADMSEALRRSTGSAGTVVRLTGHATEIEQLLAGGQVVVDPSEVIEDPETFVMEKHLEEFLIQNWKHTELGRRYDIYEEDGEPAGQQYNTDTGPVDILAISKDRKTLLVVELKKGRASDAVVGQLLRYMGYVREVLAESSQDVRGAIIALEDDQRIRRALAMVPSIDFYRYQISFKLVRA